MKQWLGESGTAGNIGPMPLANTLRLYRVGIYMIFCFTCWRNSEHYRFSYRLEQIANISVNYWERQLVGWKVFSDAYPQCFARKQVFDKGCSWNLYLKTFVVALGSLHIKRRHRAHVILI